MTAARHPWAILALGAFMVAPIFAAPVMREGTSKPDLRAWALFDRQEADRRTYRHRLVGLACGPDRLTMTAQEEDHFPGCDTIDTPEKLCGYDQGDLPTAAECAAYLGDGY